MRVHITDPGEPGSLTVVGGVGGVLMPDTSASFVPTLVSLTTATTGGSLGAATYYYVVTAVGATGETIASNEMSITTTGATSTVTLTWQSVIGASAYRVYRGTSAGGETTAYAAAASGATGGTFTDTGAGGTSITPPIVSNFAPVAANVFSGRARGATMIVPHDPSVASYAFAFSLAPTAQMDLVAIYANNAIGTPRFVLRLRRLVITNPGSQTTAGLVSLQLGLAPAYGSGGSAANAQALDPYNDPLGAVIHSGDTSVAASFTARYNPIPIWVPAAVTSFQPVVFDFGGVGAHYKTLTTSPAGGANNTIVLRHPGAAGAAGFAGYVEFTQSPF